MRLLRMSLVKLILLSMLTGGLFPTFSPPAKAQLIGGIIAGFVGNFLIDKAKSAAAELMADAEQSGNALAARLANELNVAAQNAIILAGDQLSREVRNMSRQNQLLMVNLYQMTEHIKGLSKDLYRLKDAFILDIRSLTANIPFSGDPFYIQRIDGVMQLKKRSAHYLIDVYGVGLGPASGKMRSSVEIKIDGALQEGVEVDQIEANHATLRIPNKVLEPYFKNEPTTVKCSLEITLDSKRFLAGTKTVHHSVPFRLMLMPLNAGQIVVTAKAPKKEWVPVGKELQIRTTPNLDGEERHESYELQIKVPGGRNPSIVGDKRLSNLTFKCLSGDVCNWSDVFYAELFDSNSTARAAWQTNSLPTVWRLMVDVSEYQETGTDTIEQKFDLTFGEIVIIELPETAEAIRIRGLTVGGEDIDMVYPQSSDLLRNIPNVSSGKKLTIIYKVLRPDGVD